MRAHRTPAFDAAVLPLLDDIYDITRGLTRDDKAAKELTQETFARALEVGTSARGLSNVGEFHHPE